MFSNSTISGSICSARKAAKGPKSLCQAATWSVSSTYLS